MLVPRGQVSLESLRFPRPNAPDMPVYRVFEVVAHADSADDLFKILAIAEIRQIAVKIVLKTGVKLSHDDQTTQQLGGFTGQ